EEMLRLGIVDRDDRELEYAIFFHGAESSHAGRRLLHAADDLLDALPALGRLQLLRPGTHLRVDIVEPLECDKNHGGNKVSPIVHCDLRLVLQCGNNVTIIRIVVFFTDGEDSDAKVMDETRSDVVLRAERIGSTKNDLGATRLKRASQVGSLGSNVQ